MTRRGSVLRKFRAVCLVLLFSATLTGCHELYCNFIEGLTGEPIDCSHDAFPDLDIDLPPLPPPPSLPTTTTTTLPSSTTSTSTTTSSTTTTLPSDTTTTSSTTSTSTSSTSTSMPAIMPGESLFAGELSTEAVTDSLRAARERAARR